MCSHKKTFQGGRISNPKLESSVTELKVNNLGKNYAYMPPGRNREQSELEKILRYKNMEKFI